MDALNAALDTPRRPFDVFHPDCPSRRAFDLIFSRWGILTLARLTEEPIRFGALYRSIGGISEKMLAQTLKVLEEEGLVHRQEFDEKPPRVEYNLTPAGRNIAGSIEGVIGTLYLELEHRYQDTPSS
jgi:DNA-binding HxlR family transcriptional regulator